MTQAITEQACEANIEYYRNLYTEHSNKAKEYNKQMWLWIYKQNTLQNSLEQTDRGCDDEV